MTAARREHLAEVRAALAAEAEANAALVAAREAVDAALLRARKAGVRVSRLALALDASTGSR